MSPTLQVVVTLALVAALAVEEVARAYGGRGRVWARRLAVAIVPFLVAFAVVVYERVQNFS